MNFMHLTVKLNLTRREEKKPNGNLVRSKLQLNMTTERKQRVRREQIKRSL